MPISGIKAITSSFLLGNMISESEFENGKMETIVSHAKRERIASS